MVTGGGQPIPQKWIVSSQPMGVSYLGPQVNQASSREAILVRLLQPDSDLCSTTVVLWASLPGIPPFYQQGGTHCLGNVPPPFHHQELSQLSSTSTYHFNFTASYLAIITPQLHTIISIKIHIIIFMENLLYKFHNQVYNTSWLTPIKHATQESRLQR